MPGRKLSRSYCTRLCFPVSCCKNGFFALVVVVSCEYSKLPAPSKPNQVSVVDISSASHSILSLSGIYIHAPDIAFEL